MTNKWPTPDEIRQLLTDAQCHPCVGGMPTKRFFLLEDDIHSAEGFSYLGKEADTVMELLASLEGVADWTYIVCKTATLRRVAYGTVYLEAWNYVGRRDG